MIAAPLNTRDRLARLGNLPGVRIARSRSELARNRIHAARESLIDCHLCEHHCGVNRLGGGRGLCRAGSDFRVFSAQVEVSDELEFIPVFAIAFSGCDLRCDFCITGAQSWNPMAGEAFCAETLAEDAEIALGQGARTIMILGGEPTVHLPAVLELVSCLPDYAKLIWKTNGHATAQAREWLAGLFEVWLTDYKFGNDPCALRLSRTPDYTRIVRENLLWASEHAELIVRHLIMPGHVDCCWAPVALWIAETLPGKKISLRTGFWPGWKGSRHPELCNPLPPAEENRALAIARDFGLNLIE
jgi:putative pyruvate formate lyase activating enzyme